MTSLLDAPQRQALEHSVSEAGLAITGPPGSGKSSLLIARAERALQHLRADQRLVVTTPSAASLPHLSAGLSRVTDDPRARCLPLAELAFEILRRHTPGCERIEETTAELRFFELARPLLQLSWDAFFDTATRPADFEVSGMRSPERFLGAAFRLVRKLHIADFDARRFREAAQSGARSFYGSPPNLANVDLLLSTPDRYRDSLRVDSAELQHQHDREIDLAAMLARLFERYEDDLRASARFTDGDAVFFAIREIDDAAFQTFRERTPLLFVDDAQELTLAERRLLGRIYGPRLAGVSLAGDPMQSCRTLWGALGDGAFSGIQTRIALTTIHRGEGRIVSAAQRILDRAAPNGENGLIVKTRFATQREEATSVANEIVRLLAAGLSPDEIALITRHACIAPPYVEALVARNVDVHLEVGPIDMGSGYLDALAALWSVADPHRSVWLLRNLATPWLHLADATIAQLCGTPDARLLLIPTETPSTRAGKERDAQQQLARNVFRGERDAELSETARERLAEFRTIHRRWSEWERRESALATARRILAESVLATVSDDARGRFDAASARYLLDELENVVRDRRPATFVELLEEFERTRTRERDGNEPSRPIPWRQSGVRILDPSAAVGREFTEVFVVDVRAGSFPRYFVPEAFLFTPKLGVIPFENIGDRAAKRTAKATYALWQTKAAQKYYETDRRALYLAVTRATRRASLSAWGKATRGQSAPELLEER
ncbi:MAG TPA: 3'-5' exonuclease [Candidatus Baltobacteraceae bacterium]|jgi:superfamily I DNA/RNA helicase|nr:3'-5' exonuclease [Candidatus Baltobacteraceae bacterium]